MHVHVLICMELSRVWRTGGYAVALCPLLALRWLLLTELVHEDAQLDLQSSRASLSMQDEWLKCSLTVVYMYILRAL